MRSELKTTTLRDQMLELIEWRRSVSFVELSRLDGTAGEEDILLGDPSKNLVLWTGLSKEAADALVALLSERLIEPRPANTFVYLIDGGVLKLPLARHTRGYKRPHWLPVVFYPTKRGEAEAHKLVGEAA